MNEHKQLNIKNAEAYDLASEIATIRGTSRTDAVLTALRAEAERARQTKDSDEAAVAERIARINAIVDEYNSWPPGDTRSADEILGYDENGLPM